MEAAARGFSDDASPTFHCADENPGAEGSCQSLNSASAKPLWRECQTVNYAPCPIKETGKFFLDASSPCFARPPSPSQITGSVSLSSNLARQLRSEHSTLLILLTFWQHRFGGHPYITSTQYSGRGSIKSPGSVYKPHVLNKGRSLEVDQNNCFCGLHKWTAPMHASPESSIRRKVLFMHLAELVFRLGTSQFRLPFKFRD